MFTIQSSLLTVSVQSKGAELQRISRNDTGLEYMWDADPAYWAKKSPVLFPIVGTLKDDTYYYNGQAYHLPRHGFAREEDFAVTAQSDQAVTLTLTHSEATLQVYPFPFELAITYRVDGNRLTVTYAVKNRGEEFMYFSIGGHPAFNVPLVPGTEYSDYVLQFNKKENAGRWPLAKGGVLQTEATPCLQHTDVLPLSKELFREDALVFKHLQSDAVTLRSDKTPHGLTFTFAGFPYLGIWAAPGADFVCIEPWCGIADSVDSDQQLPHKEGIIPLPAGETFEASWQAVFF